MPTHDLYSKRRARESKSPDVFIYDTTPRALRVQVYHAVVRALFLEIRYAFFGEIEQTLLEEYGVLELVDDHFDTPEESVLKFLTDVATDEQALDVIELFLRYVEPLDRGADAIEVTNQRFTEHAVGYRYENGNIIRIDSEFTHSKVVKPALALLSGADFENADQEFRTAHEHLRHGRVEDANTGALKALESTMKVICDRQGWEFDQNATASRLIAICFANGLVSPSLQAHFNSLQSTLESGVPTIRNRGGGHGKGTSTEPVPAHVARYALNLTAAAILFLIQCDDQLRER